MKRVVSILISQNKRINLESRIDEGDAVIFYGSLVHGVEAIDPDKALSWKSNKGRWFWACS